MRCSAADDELLRTVFDRYGPILDLDEAISDPDADLSRDRPPGLPGTCRGVQTANLELAPAMLGRRTGPSDLTRGANASFDSTTCRACWLAWCQWLAPRNHSSGASEICRCR